jgi:hypothetical protein
MLDKIQIFMIILGHLLARLSHFFLANICIKVGFFHWIHLRPMICGLQNFTWGDVGHTQVKEFRRFIPRDLFHALARPLSLQSQVALLKSENLVFSSRLREKNNGDAA